ncbi:hypothetical protein, partial [uncultured Enterovirga sp.]|uniref:hypothetical protein n=1 Tax=uncultured Enterovirga sp. TaxID=2026352 RepID=UPI0035CB9941
MTRSPVQAAIRMLLMAGVALPAALLSGLPAGAQPAPGAPPAAGAPETKPAAPAPKAAPAPAPA